jgi:hypothetical protein
MPAAMETGRDFGERFGQGCLEPASIFVAIGNKFSVGRLQLLDCLVF